MTDKTEKMAGVISAEEFEAGKGVWPCVRCGRLEHETCNGMGTGDYCPNGRKHEDMLAERWPTLKAACKIDPAFVPEHHKARS